MDRALGDGLAPPARLDADDVYPLLASALLRCAPGRRPPTRTWCWSPTGPANSAWHEHCELAAHMSLPLATPDDLEHPGRPAARRRRRRATRPVDVVYRRTDEDRLRDRHGRPTWLSELLLPGVRAGTLTVVNPLGSGVADDKLVHAYVEAMVRFYLGEEPLLRIGAARYDLGDPEQRTAALDRLGELVVKPRDGLRRRGRGAVPPMRVARSCATPSGSVRERPDSFVAQEMVALSTHPTVVERAGWSPVMWTCDRSCRSEATTIRGRCPPP